MWLPGMPRTPSKSGQWNGKARWVLVKDSELQRDTLQCNKTQKERAAVIRAAVMFRIYVEGDYFLVRTDPETLD